MSDYQQLLKECAGKEHDFLCVPRHVMTQLAALYYQEHMTDVGEILGNDDVVFEMLDAIRDDDLHEFAMLFKMQLIVTSYEGIRRDFNLAVDDILDAEAIAHER